MTVSAQFLLLYSVALAIVSTISTIFFVQTYSLHKRAMNWYGVRLAGINKRWNALGPDSDPMGDFADRDVRAEPADDDLLADPPDPYGRPAEISAPDAIIRDLVAALIPEQLTSTTARPPIMDDVEFDRPVRASAMVPTARNGQRETDLHGDDRWEAEGGLVPDVDEPDCAEQDEPSQVGPTRTVTHAPQLQPATPDYPDVQLQPATADGAGPRSTDSQRNDPAQWFNGVYRGRHEAELLIYPTAPFPLIVRNERDGGSKR